MSKLKAFTLIELLVVTLLIAIVTFLIIKLPSFLNPKIEIQDLRDFLYPDGKIFILEDNEIVVTKNDRNLTNFDLTITNPVVYKYTEQDFEKVRFDPLNDKKVLFRYSVTNSLGDYFILQCDEGFFVFKPLYIKKAKDFEEAKKIFLLSEYQPREGEFY